VGEQLLANEVAPRVHNSGHWTIEGAHTSQFENHLRAILNLPLGSTAARGVSAMVNLIGELPDIPPILRIEGAHLHLYGKSPRKGRKLGHITLCADDHQSLRKRLALLISRASLQTDSPNLASPPHDASAPTRPAQTHTTRHRQGHRCNTPEPHNAHKTYSCPATPSACCSARGFQTPPAGRCCLLPTGGTSRGRLWGVRRRPSHRGRRGLCCRPRWDTRTGRLRRTHRVGRGTSRRVRPEWW
jgi:hypothetical protein